jgi:hypothetical protein
MAGNRHHRVLFDLVQGEGRKPAEPTRGDGKAVRADVGVGPAIEPKPAAAPAPAATASVGAGATAGSPPSRPRIEVISPDAVREASSPRRTKDVIALKTNAVYIGIAVILLAIAIVWILAYNAGSKAKSAELKEFLQEPAPRDPLAAGTSEGVKPVPTTREEPAAPKKTTPPPRSPERQPPTPTQTPTQSPSQPKTANRAPNLPQPLAEVAPEGSGSILVPGGRVARDPRPGGYNYLIVERLPPADAERAIKFLADNGIQCVGVPVDRAAGAGNNPLLYQVVALAGLTREQYRDNAGRDALEAEVKRLGEIWQKEQKGTSRFAKPQWVRFGGSP